MTLPTGIIRTPEGVHVLVHDTHLSRWIEEHGRLDIAEGEIAKFAKYIPVGGVVVDAGSSLGDHALTYAKLVGPTGLVMAFEPNPLTFAAMRLNMAGYPWVSTKNAALGATSGFGWIGQNDNIGASTFNPSEDGPVACVTLDEAMPFGVVRLDFIHLDCEGGEIDALMGAQNTIRRFHPVMVIEINKGCLARVGKSEQDLLNVLDFLGYRTEELEPGYGAHMEQRDVICLPKS